MRAWGLTPPQWRELSDSDREDMLLEDELICPECGHLRSVCSDPTSVWYPQRAICYNRAEVDLVLRRLRDGHSAPGWSAHPMDGVRVFAADVDYSPDDDFIPKKAVKR